MQPHPIQLTIAIPTWNRAAYLHLNLEQIAKELKTIEPHVLEIIVSDNASADKTPAVVQHFIAQGTPIRYIRNPENIGSDSNIAQCFNEASGRYVLILGDDDLLVDGALAKIFNIIELGDYGVIFLRPYGYNDDFRAEWPGGKALSQEFNDPEKFIVKIAALAGLISCNLIGKHALSDVDARNYCGTNLVQTYLIYEAALRMRKNMYMGEYLVAYKRNNWGVYPFTLVFVERFWAIIDHFYTRLGDDNIKRLAAHMLIQYYPFYVWKQRLKPTGDLKEDYQRFYTRFHSNSWFWITIAPQYALPRPLAVVWGAGIVLLGRAMKGDARRGIHFLWNLIARKLSLAVSH